MKFTDSHCHLDFDELQKQFKKLLEECARLNINRLIVPAVSPDNWSNVMTLANAGNTVKIYACLGIHPWFLQNLNDKHLVDLSEQVSLNKENIIAIGETGIDGVISKNAENPEKNLKQQQHFFDAQVELAQQHKLSLIVHHRQSHQYILPILKHYKLASSGIIHAFSGSYQQAKDYIDLGFKLGIGGTITYPRAKKTINAIKRLPLSSLVLETDAPAMPLFTMQGQPNSPVNIINIFQVLKTIRVESAEVIAKQLEDNIDQVFFSS